MNKEINDRLNPKGIVQIRHFDSKGNPKKLFDGNFLWEKIKKWTGLDLKIPLLLGSYRTIIIKENLIVNVGLKRAADLLGGTNSATAMSALAIGLSSTAPAAADTTLGNEITSGGGSRGVATVTNTTTTVTGDTEQFQKTWTFTASIAVAEEGIFDNNTSGGNMFAHNTFSTVNVVSGDSLQITHKIIA